jgi:hypothetical protein
MALTVTERDHWKERIGARIEKKITAIKMARKEEFDGLRAKARENAIAALEIGDLESKRAKLKEEAERIERQRNLANRQAAAAIRGVDLAEVSQTYGIEEEIKQAIKKRQEFELEALFATTEDGRRVLDLKRERDNLLDTVWLATSPQQVKELWQKLGAILGDEETALQKEALAIKPTE